jgi:hypothetical protein
VKNKQGKRESRYQEQYVAPTTYVVPPRPRSYPVSLPDIAHMDDLATLTDDQLLDTLRKLELDRDKVLDARMDPKPWETEASYIRREIQLRRRRHELHDQYLVALDREMMEAQRLENSYPVADLDNSSFMFV